MTDYPDRTLRLRSTLTRAGELRLTLAEEAVAAPQADEVVVRMEAAPINPTDIGLMFGAADLSSATFADGVTSLNFVAAALPSFAARFDQALAVGSEGAGTVVAAGDDAQHLLGRVVSVAAAQVYASYRTVKASNCCALPEGVTAVQGAAAFINPVTALGMVETMRLDGHKAIVHNPAASNLGQMLLRVCREEHVPLVNIVRRDAQAAMLRSQGAEYVCNSGDDDFAAQLGAAVETTQATLAFDAAGGTMPGRILKAMEDAAVRRMPTYSHYGSPETKQVYIYGGLDPSPPGLTGFVGMAWRLDGWLLYPFLNRVTPQRAAELRRRAADGVTTTFASHFDRTISLSEVIQPDIIQEYTRRATGKKYLINLLA